MALSTTGAPSNGLVYLTFSGKDASGNSIVEQGSGVLISSDEVLTAAHLVYNPDGSLRTAGSATVGSGTAAPTAAVSGVQVGAFQNYASVAGMSSDFAVVHLSTQVTDGTIFSLGSDMTSGTFQVSGFPAGTAGALDTKTETLSVASGTQVYTGQTLNEGGNNPNGSSGGSIYQVVNGNPTAYGVISADLTSDTSKGFFKELTSADVAQIKAWVATADSGGSTSTSALASASASTVTSTSAVTNTSSGSATALVSHSASGFNMDMAAMLNDDAGAFGGGRQAAMMDVAAAITKACQDGGSFADLVQDASNYLKTTSAAPGRDVGYLAGLLSGTTSTWMSNITKTANSLIGGAVSNTWTKAFANAGRQEGVGMGIANTGNTMDSASVALATAIATPVAGTSQVHQADDAGKLVAPTLVAPRHLFAH